MKLENCLRMEGQMEKNPFDYFQRKINLIFNSDIISGRLLYFTPTHKHFQLIWNLKTNLIH